ncbi:TatD family hydrolase [Oscillatoria sp. CS-180]|uniref:TatD family hydrolase n=1 Tax=Oscillatoria sp. CS-180 TaxID=3021720 RepID=UPI00232B23C3|nr:TatD family hydrolase [Oscillatoria sp. CS-180]MDB9528023.1 TatD family hydrolase [Oscillatoria sp. CS-180]
MPPNSQMVIDPHIHMTSRTTYDYLVMKEYGVVAVIEPAFWLGQPRTHIGTFQDYFNSLIGWERFRAGQFGVRHYCTISINPKEANNEALAEQVMELLPLYACKEGVVALGEVGFDDMTAAEEKYFRLQLELAKELDKLVLVHTPHRNKKEGTSRSMDICLEHGLDPLQVVIDHANEETVAEVLDRGFWCAFSIYPNTKMGNERMVEVLKKYGSDRIFIDSAADWGLSDPLAVPKTAQLMLESGIPQEQVTAVCYGNALKAYGQSGEMKADDWLNPPAIDQRQLYNGNSVLRGQTPTIYDPAKESMIIR